MAEAKKKNKKIKLIFILNIILKMEISQENEKDINNNISPEAPEENKTIEDPNPNKLISDILLNELSEYGYTEENLISQNEANLFFTRKLKKENNLSQKLFSFLNLTEYNTITISKFISSIFQLEEELKKEKEKLNEEFLEQKKIYDEIINMYKRMIKNFQLKILLL